MSNSGETRSSNPSSNPSPYGAPQHPAAYPAPAPGAQQWPDYNSAYSAYYQSPQTAGAAYNPYPQTVPPPPPAVPAPAAPSQYPGGYPPYGAYPPQSMGGAPPPQYPPNPVPPPGPPTDPKTSPSQRVTPKDMNRDASSDGRPPPNMNAPLNAVNGAAPQPYYPPQHPPAHAPPPQSQGYYNYGGAPPPYGQPGPYQANQPPPNPYANHYNAPPPPPHAGGGGGYPNQGHHNNDYYNRPRPPFNNRNANQPPAWTNDPGTVKVEGFPTDIALDELRSTFNVGPLKKEQYTGYDQICVSPDRQCAFLCFEEPSVAEAAVVMLNESSIRGQKISVQLYDGSYQNQQGFKRRYEDNNYNHSQNHHNNDNHGYHQGYKRPCFEPNPNNQHHTGHGGQNQGYQAPHRENKGPNWPCPACPASNHAHRWNCYKCRTPKPDLEKGPGEGNFPNTHNRTAEDWICASCNNHNFAKRLICNRCKLPKPSNPTLAPMTGANNTPLGAQGGTAATGAAGSFAPPFNPTSVGKEWDCSKCGSNNDMTKLVCAKCQQPKPGIPQKTLDVLNKLNAIKNSNSDGNNAGGNSSSTVGGGGSIASGAASASNGQSAASRWSDK